MVPVSVYRRLTASRERFVTISGRGYRPRAIALGSWGYAVCSGPVALLALIVLLPFCVLLLTSLLPCYSVPTWETIRQLTLKHYAFLLTSDRVARALRISVMLAVSGATLGMLLASAVAYLTVRTPVAGPGALAPPAFIPSAFPGAAGALGLLWGSVRPPAPGYAPAWV